MKRDSLIFQFFEELPRGFFEAIGRPEVDPNQYELKSIEYKETAVRLDGVFLPRQSTAAPAYVWEAQWYASNKVYANLLSKIGRFLEHGNPTQMWIAVVVYPSRSIEQKNLEPYECLLNSRQMVRIYLDELPPAQADQIELRILQMIAAEPERALHDAKQLVPLVKSSGIAPEFQSLVIQFIETVILYQFPNLTREEIKKVVHITDVRQIRIVREALEEGREEGREEAALAIAKRLLLLNKPIKEVAEATELPLAKLRALKKKVLPDGVRNRHGQKRVVSLKAAGRPVPR